VIISGLLPLAVTGFGIAFLHAALPTHWLPFVLVGRRQGWATRRTLGIAALAGAGHVLITAGLGLLLILLGMAVDAGLRPWLPRIGAMALVVLGLAYLLGWIHRHGAAQEGPNRSADRIAIAGLVLTLALSPCEAFLPVYLTGFQHGWLGFGILSLVLAAGTGLAMMIFTAVSLIGATRLGLDRLAKYETRLLGTILILIGVVVLVIETQHL
jgi:nickel/cobalt exporter